MKILIVEDDADSGEALTDLLIAQGHAVRLVQDPERAAAEALEFLPDVAILDIGLPFTSGYDLIEILRALPSLRGCRYLAVTGYVDRHFAERSAASGFEHHLTKPLHWPRLLRCIEKG